MLTNWEMLGIGCGIRRAKAAVTREDGDGVRSARWGRRAPEVGVGRSGRRLVEKGGAAALLRDRWTRLFFGAASEALAGAGGSGGDLISASCVERCGNRRD
jgi:hypothetical protein